MTSTYTVYQNSDVQFTGSHEEVAIFLQETPVHVRQYFIVVHDKNKGVYTTHMFLVLA